MRLVYFLHPLLWFSFVLLAYFSLAVYCHELTSVPPTKLLSSLPNHPETRYSRGSHSHSYNFLYSKPHPIPLRIPASVVTSTSPRTTSHLPAVRVRASLSSRSLGTSTIATTQSFSLAYPHGHSSLIGENEFLSIFPSNNRLRTVPATLPSRPLRFKSHNYNALSVSSRQHGITNGRVRASANNHAFPSGERQQKSVTGIWTALITPFLNSQANPELGTIQHGNNMDYNEPRIDYDAFRRLVQFQIEAGVDALIPASTTGAGPLLTKEEKLRLLEITIEETGLANEALRCYYGLRNNDPQPKSTDEYCRVEFESVNGHVYTAESLSQRQSRVQVWAATGNECTRNTIDCSIQASKMGIDGLLIVVPYYLKPNEDGIRAHYEAVAGHSNITVPILIYNVPARTVVDCPDRVIVNLAQNPKIVGIKDATGKIERMTGLQTLLRDHRQHRGQQSQSQSQNTENFSILSGDDSGMFEFFLKGGNGIISVISNLMPLQMVSFWREMQLYHESPNEHTLDMVKRVYAPIQQMMAALDQTGQPNPLPIKWAMHKWSTDFDNRYHIKCQAVERLPMTILPSQHQGAINQALQAVFGTIRK